MRAANPAPEASAVLAKPASVVSTFELQVNRSVAMSQS